jgi:hypothetical protein
VLGLAGDDLPDEGAELTFDDRPVGRLTSVARDPEEGVVALAFVRREVPADAELSVAEGRAARQLH